MSITAKKLAQQLGLSEAAVSLALRNKSGVSERTRQLVLKAAQESGYDFSKQYAQSAVRANITFMIYKRHGAVVMDTPFFFQVSEGISIACKALHASLQIVYVYNQADIESQLKELAFSSCMGIIVLATEMTEKDFTPFFDASIPFVLLDAYYDTVAANSITINNIQGAYMATDYMIQKYRQQPGYLHSSYHIANFDERADGFYKAVRNSGLSSSRSIVHRLAPSVEGAYTDMCILLEQKDPLARCYFADNDLIAVGALRAFEKYGYQIPQDIAIVGFDDLPTNDYAELPLTTVHVPKQYMGQLAVERLYQITQQKGTLPVRTAILTSMKVRQSG